MRIKTEGIHAGEFLLSEANGSRSRANIVVAAGSGIVSAGTLMALITAANAITATANAGNTGDGTVGSTSATSDAVSGTYALTIESADDGVFKLASPSGAVVGHGEVGQAFSEAGINFTLSAGATGFADGDGFELSVLANLGEYMPYDADGANDGRRDAAGILFGSVDATDTDAMAVAIVRDAEVIESVLTGLDDDGAADLEAAGIVIRP